MENVIVAVTEIAEVYPLEEAKVFGSYVNGNHTLDSDIDLALIFSDEFNILKRRRELQEYFAANVDLLIFSRRQYNALLEMAPHLSVEEDPWDVTGNPAYQISLGKTIWRKS